MASAALIVSSTLFSGHAWTAVIYESATLGATGRLGGAILSDSQFLGSRFSLASSAIVTSIAGHIAGIGTLFGAIVELCGPNALPTGSPLSGTEVVASGTFVATAPSSEQILPLSVLLNPGDYAVIFGSGQFGATGVGVMPGGVTTIGSPSYFF